MADAWARRDHSTAFELSPSNGHMNAMPQTVGARSSIDIYIAPPTASGLAMDRFDHASVKLEMGEVFRCSWAA